MRPRKTQRNLPPCVYQKHGAYWYVKNGKWTRLAPDLPNALLRYAVLAVPKDSGMASLIETAHIEIVRNVKPNTASQYDQCRRVLKEILADFNPEQVRGSDVAQIKAAYADRPNMGNRILSYLRLVFSYAVERGVVDTNPCIGIKRHTEAKRRRYLSDDEFQAIYNAGSDSLKPIMMMAFLTGQRIGDILKIRLADISAEGVYFEQEKTGGRVLVAMSQDLDRAIKAARSLPRPVRTLYLFSVKRGGRPYNYHTVKDMWNAAVEKSGVKDAHLHDLRAKSLTDAKKQGLDPVALAGHADARMTARYIRQHDTVVAVPPKMGEF
ncbi:tyrosine-type recombinase/integrase [Acidithiobacillus ferrooxidans]|uniref:tyrosine-type recombinase/integrase n=1 Tax=Acidithiobacillus ferrooxidans TaxID=920 RepID=UPI001C07A4D1|nr:tyrosine-type recombinase/integrase [Acidithiobacillus ferrooxidans]MBU2774302.1 tyrosine-type recombinase/integrase [Acidithiobacillus ferrooxidans]